MDQRSTTEVEPGIVGAAKEASDVRNEQMQHFSTAQRCIVCGARSRWARWYPSRCWGRQPIGVALRR